MIKTISLIIISVAVLTENLLGQYFWQRVESPTDYSLRTLHFEDSLRGWVAGDSGQIFYTSDGGTNWIQQQTNTNTRIMKLFFLDENRGWALAWQELRENDFYGTYILKTTDGGINWISEQYREEGVFMWAIHFLDNLKGFMGGVPGEFVVTSNGGLNWEDANIDSGVFANFPVKNFSFYNDLYGYACGGRFDIAGVIWRTTNGGESWSPLDPQYSPPDEVWDIHFFDSLHVMGVGGDPDLYGVGTITSTDAGNSWAYVEIGVYGQARAVSFRTENEGWCPVPLSENFVATFDYGNNWTNYPAIDSTALYDLVFTDSLTGFAAGEGGVILKYKYHNPVFVGDDSYSAPDEFVLYQNFPNPFNSSTSISYYISEPSQVSVKIYNAVGSYIVTLSDDYQSSGNYNLTWEADSEASGIYYIQLSVNGNLSAKKMVLLK